MRALERVVPGGKWGKPLGIALLALMAFRALRRGGVGGLLVSLAGWLLGRMFSPSGPGSDRRIGRTR